MATTARRRSKNTDSPGIKLEVDGRTYVVREADLTPRMVRELRQEVGYSWAGLGRELTKDPDIDLIAALAWLSRRIDGEAVTYDAVLDSMSYESKMEIGTEDPRSTEGDDSPEA